MTNEELVAQTDALRPLRMFVGGMLGAAQASDQSQYGQDAYTGNAPGGFQVIGPNGYSIEGRPVSTAQQNSNSVVIAPNMMLIALALGAALLWKK